MKMRPAQIIAYLCYFTGIDSIFYFLNRKTKRIITFHNVMPTHLLPEGKKIGLTDTEEEFRMKIREVKKHFIINADINDKKSAVITFDDGYKNQYEVAGRILREEGNLPAIIFAAGKEIENQVPKNALVVDLLFHWTMLAPNGTYRLSIPCAVKQSFELTSDNRDQIWQKIIFPTFSKDSISMGCNLLSALNLQHNINEIFAKCEPEYLRLRLTGISNSDIDVLHKRGWLVGWHTQNHYPLSRLTCELQEQEIRNSPTYMKSVVFSYPYGEEASVSDTCLKYAEDAGYPCAVSNLPYAQNMSGQFFKSRFTLEDNKYMLHFELSGAKCFIKYRKLLSK